MSPLATSFFLSRRLLFRIFFDAIEFEVIFLLWHFLPLRYIDSIIAVIDLFLTDFFEVLPFFLLVLAHDVALRRLIVFCLCDVVDEARIACLFADVDSPHLKLFAVGA